MSKIRLHGSSSGYTEIAPVAASGNNTLTLPNDGTIISNDSAGAVGVTSVVTDTIKVGAAVTIGESGVNVVGVVTASSGIVGLTSTGLPAGAVINAVSTTITAASSQYLSSGYYWNCPVKVSITPSHANNKVLVMGYVMVSVVGPQHNIGVSLHKDGSAITGYKGDADGDRRVDAAVGTNMVSSYENFTGQINFQYLDTAGGTSAIEYGVSIRNPSSSSRTAYINRATTDTDSSNHYRTASTITVMEIKV